MVDIWEEVDDKKDYMTDDQVREFKQIMRLGMSKKIEYDEYLDRLAEFWRSIGEQGYAEECNMKKGKDII